MLEVNMEFRKGILFVRLEGIIVRKNCHKLNDIQMMIKTNGIKYLVLNINDLRHIDAIGLYQLQKLEQYVSVSGGKTIICGDDMKSVKKQIEQTIFVEDVWSVNSELTALNLINI